MQQCWYLECRLRPGHWYSKHMSQWQCRLGAHRLMSGWRSNYWSGSTSSSTASKTARQRVWSIDEVRPKGCSSKLNLTFSKSFLACSHVFKSKLLGVQLILKSRPTKQHKPLAYLLHVLCRYKNSCSFLPWNLLHNFQIVGPMKQLHQQTIPQLPSQLRKLDWVSNNLIMLISKTLKMLLHQKVKFQWRFQRSK